jgi:cytochrome P450
MNLNEFLNRASLDKISSVMFGVSTRISNPTYHSDPADAEFCRAAAEGLRLNAELMLSGYHILANMAGRSTRKDRRFEVAWTQMINLTLAKVRRLRHARAAGTLTPAQQRSFMNQVMERQMRQDNRDSEMYIEETEIDHIAGGLFSAGVDTTGGMLSWKLLHLAAHPEVQEKAYVRRTDASYVGNRNPGAAPFIVHGHALFVCSLARIASIGKYQHHHSTQAIP